MTSVTNIVIASMFYLSSMFFVRILDSVLTGVMGAFSSGLLSTVLKVMFVLVYIVLLVLFPIAIAKSDESILKRIFGEEK